MAVEESVIKLAEELSRMSTKNLIDFSVVLNVPFCPIKQKLRKKQSEVSMVKIPLYNKAFFDFFEKSDGGYV